MANCNAVLIFHEHLLSCRPLADRRDILWAYEDVCADLANMFRQTIAVEVVVLYLEVLAERNEDGQRKLVRGVVGNAALYQS